MKKDYSEYQFSEREKYRLYRQGNKNVSFDFFINNAVFHPSHKELIIEVDSYNEFISMKEEIDEYEKFEATMRNVHPDIMTEEELSEEEEFRLEGLKQNEEDIKYFDSKYDVDRNDANRIFNRLYEDSGIDKKQPLNNVLSGCRICLGIGKGILDFVYADFETPFKKRAGYVFAFNHLIDEHRKENPKLVVQRQKPEKVYNKTQENVEEYFNYTSTLIYTKEISQASLYTTICPPVFRVMCNKNALVWYYEYLRTLQKEYLELIEFCFDETFFPEVLGKRIPSERYYIYKKLHDNPPYSRRKEIFAFKVSSMSGDKMPYGMKPQEFIDRLQSEIEVTEQHKAFSEKYNIDLDELTMLIKFPHFINTKYEFRSAADILELEFTKMLEQDIRFRKCKRCGKYFIMKGNYNTNYCDRITDSETRNCQDIMALENYKKKMADNAAIKIYNKYYKRYSARVKAHTILEKDFKKWKYEAMTKRNECMDGKITEDDFVSWLESCFPNKNRKH